jgi:predicted nucleotidyltransferase
MYRVLLNETVIAEVVSRLIAAVNPDKIILFGSRARGNFRPDSDLDLLLIGASPEPAHVREIRANDALRGLRIPKDVLWYTPEEVRDWSGVRNHLISRALREGKILYEKQP